MNTAFEFLRSLRWSQIILGCLILFAAQLVLTLASVFLGLAMPGIVVTLAAMVIAGYAVASMVPERKLLHGLLVPVTYYLLSMAIILVMSALTSGSTQP